MFLPIILPKFYQQCVLTKQIWKWRVNYNKLLKIGLENPTSWCSLSLFGLTDAISSIPPIHCCDSGVDQQINCSNIAENLFIIIGLLMKGEKYFTSRRFFQTKVLTIELCARADVSRKFETQRNYTFGQSGCY